MDSFRCVGNCGCHWFRVSDANTVFKSTWPRDLVYSGRWAVCHKDTGHMHVRYVSGMTEKNLLVKYLHHTTPETAPTMIQSDICAKCGEVQVTREYDAPDPMVPPFRFVPCRNVAASVSKK